MKEYFILQLLHRQFTGQLEDADKTLLSDWVSQSPDNQAFSDSILRIWHASANYSPPVSFETRTESAFEKFKSAIQNEQPQAPVTKTMHVVSPKEPTASIRSLNPARWLTGIAAAAILTFGAYFLMQQDGNSSSFATLATIADQTQEIQLADESTVWVNEKSTIKYFDEVPSEDRRILLDGVAFFDVAPNGKPFIVETDNAFIRVLGTEFNVTATKDKTSVMVKEGKVELQPKLSNQKIILMENMTGVYEVPTKKLYRKKSKTYNGDSWMTGGFSFEDEKLSDVFEVLENHFNTDIYLKNLDLRDCEFTSPVYQDTKLEEVLDVMQIIYGFSYELKDGRYIIEDGSCGNN